MALYFITGNAGKFREIKAVVPHVEQLDVDLDEIQSLDPQKVIEHKLAQAASLHDGEFFVEDTILTFSCLNQLPGTYVKHFRESLGLEGLAGLALKYDDHSATARVTIGYRDESGDNHYFSAELPGTIVMPRGDNGFGWDPIFVPQGHDRTYAEMTDEEKGQFGLRGMAARKLADYLKS